jgi:hypothetical protein
MVLRYCVSKSVSIYCVSDLVLMFSAQTCGSSRQAFLESFGLMFQGSSLSRLVAWDLLALCQGVGETHSSLLRQHRLIGNISDCNAKCLGLFVMQ